MCKPRGRRPLPSHLKRERVVHDLSEADKHCSGCGENLRHIGEEVSERYEYIPAQMLVVEDACQKYACSCTVRTAGKPVQPIEFSGEDPSAVLTAMMGSIGRDGLLTDSRIYFRNLTMNDRDRVAQTVVGGASSPATGGNGFAGNTWANAVIELDIDSWRGMSGLEQARTLIHELGHM